jgi:hypothetical protein
MGNSCENQEQPKTEKYIQAEKAKEAANSLKFIENVEIDNIKKHLELTAQPGLLGFMALINNVGQVALYTPVHGKVTSCTKRLTKPQNLVTMGNGNGGSSGVVVPAPSDEGTWGSGSDCVYFWTPAGQYFRSNMAYVYSDKPFRPSSEPLLVITHNTENKESNVQSGAKKQ